MSQEPSDAQTLDDKILNGKAIAASIRDDLKERVAAWTQLNARQPQLVAVLVGADPASAAYVRSKAKTCQAVGMLGRTLRLDANISADALRTTIQELNDDPLVDGILVQLPLPAHVDERPILELIRPDKDVDGFHPMNVGRLWSGEEALAPATPSGVIELLVRSEIPIQGQHAVIVGRSNIVGKPMAALLLGHHATVSICHSRTRDLESLCRQADILIAAVGRPAMIGADHVKEGAVVIDVGINRVDDRETLDRLYPHDAKRSARFDKKGYFLTGDVDFHAARQKAGAITPVPGGVGPLTVAMVVANTLRAAEMRTARELRAKHLESDV